MFYVGYRPWYVNRNIFHNIKWEYHIIIVNAIRFVILSEKKRKQIKNVATLLSMVNSQRPMANDQRYINNIYKLDWILSPLAHSHNVPVIHIARDMLNAIKKINELSLRVVYFALIQ